VAFTINTNIASLQAQDYLRVTQKFQGQTINRVTSGLRIVNSGDDAAGLAIANSYRSNESVLTQGVRNANDALSQLQIADGGINNISQLLDRARTLATQSASGAFTGDRGVLNSEFQSVLSEIDRQAQSIGLNQGGQFAKALNVFIGGGQASNGISVTQNGSVALDLGQSTVDSKSLGLKGVQAVNVGGRDLSAGQPTSVQAIVQDANNVQPNNTTTFYFAGPGFSDAKRVAVAVNLTGVTDTNTLAAAVNTAIQNAGNGASSAATAFKNAIVTASVYTDPNGGQHLALNSGSAAFQVQAGDVLANALLGNTTSANSPDGSAIATTVTGGANASNAALGAQATVRFQGGGLTSPVDITLAAGKTITDLQTAVANDATLKSAGITLTTAANGSPLVFTSARGEQFSVEAAGDTANLFGLGTFRYGAANVVDYSTITAAANYDNTTAKGTANLEFSVNGSGTTGHVISVNLAAGDATAGSITGTTDLTTTSTTAGHILNVTVDGGAVQAISLAADSTAAALVTDINSKLVGATASLVIAGGQTHLKITSNTTGAGSSVATAAGTGLAEAFGGVASATGLSRTLGNVVQAVNQAIAGDSTLQAAGLVASNPASALVLASNNGTYFQLNAYGANADLGFGAAGAAFGGGNVSANSGLVAFEAGGAYQTAAFSFTGVSHGNDSQTITVTANDATGKQQSQSIVLQDGGATRNARTLDEAIGTINSALQKSNIAALQGIAAVKDDVSGTEKIRFVSTDAFSVAIGTDANATGIQSQGTNNAAAIIGAAATADISNVSTALAAVNAVGTAVSKLGNAQAVVGRGENQFNYAINLAQSQLTNFSAAEAQIRDADLATESANLTKSQILLQAGIAALAQANSAPQQVLALLRA